jgi:hypothetical protein
MRFLKTLGILIFFIYYYIVIALTIILNCVAWLWKIISRKDSDKHRVSPYEVTHRLVFAQICKSNSTQNKSSLRAVIS